MKFYAYKGTYKLKEEPCGSFDKLIINDLKTIRGQRKDVLRYLKMLHLCCIHIQIFIIIKLLT